MKYLVKLNGCIANSFNDKQVLFHGVNKSGSLCLSSAIKESYYAHGRHSQFYSRYHSIPRDIESFREVIQSTQGHIFAVDHDIYQNVPSSRVERVWITQLRHPLPRVVSLYHWNLNKYREKHGNVVGYPTLLEFIMDIKERYWAYQYTQFGLGFSSERFNIAKELSRGDIFENCIANLIADFPFIGIAEMFEETLYLLSGRLGLDYVFRWHADNRNSGRLLVSDLDREIVELIEDVFYLDYQLYYWAKSRLEEMVLQEEPSGDFSRYKNDCMLNYKDKEVLPQWKSSLNINNLK